jgi:hypothetical protein
MSKLPYLSGEVNEDCFTQEIEEKGLYRLVDKVFRQLNVTVKT